MKRSTCVWFVVVNTCAAALSAAPKPARPAKPAPTTRPAAPAAKPAAAPTPAQLAELSAKVAQLYQDGKFAEAEAVLDEILRANPRDAVAWYNLACVQARQGKKDDAMVSLLRAAREGYTEADHAEKDDDLKPLRAEPAFKRLIERMRKTASATKTTKTTGKDYDEQHRARQIVGLNRKLIGVFKARKYAEAEQLLKEILQIDPNNSTAHYNMACVFGRLGDKPRAVEWLTKAVELGYAAFRHMERDEDLAPIRDMPGYRDILARREELQKKRAEKIYDRLKEQFGAGYLYGIDHDMKLVFATNVDQQTLDDMKKRLSEYAAAQMRDLFTHPFDEYLTVVVPKEWRWGPAIGGFYNRAGHILYARSLGMVLIHEFTHALHFADQDGRGQTHPIWIAEGLATLFETSEMENGTAVPKPNHRLNVLQGVVRAKRQIKFEQLIRDSHAQFMRQAMYAYPEVRYMMMYLYEKGLLRKWYDAYTEGFGKDETGGNAMEKLLGKDLDNIEKDWCAWVMKLKAPPRGAARGRAYIGIQLKAAVDGVEIVSVVPGSGADKAGLKPGDVIVKIDEQRIIDPGELSTLVAEHKVGDKVKVQFRRSGKYQDATVTLAAAPDLKSRRPKSPLPKKAEPAKKPESTKKPQPAGKATPPATQPADRKKAA